MFVSAGYAMPGQTEVNFIYTPSKSGAFGTTEYGKEGLFSGFDQLSFIKDETSVVPKTFELGDTTITSRYTSDDISCTTISSGLNLTYKVNDKLNISSAAHIVNMQNNKYTQIVTREDGYFDLSTDPPKPHINDSVFPDNNDKTRLVGNIQATYSISEIHSIFARISSNYEDAIFQTGGGFHSKNSVVDFEIQDNFEILSFNKLSVGAN